MNKLPTRDKQGRSIHYCMADDCTQWGCFGFHFGKIWFCGAHQAQGLVAVDVSAEIYSPTLTAPAQGRLI